MNVQPFIQFVRCWVPASLLYLFWSRGIGLANKVPFSWIETPPKSRKSIQILCPRGSSSVCYEHPSLHNTMPTVRIWMCQRLGLDVCVAGLSAARSW